MAEGAGYPIMLHLQDKQVAVIGGGKVGARKTRHLLRAGARVLLISPDIDDDLRKLVHAGEIEWIALAYQRDMLNEAMPILVIAATDDPRVNQTVAQDAHRIRALCNVTDGSSELSDFSNMALIERQPLTIALGSNGMSPALSRLLKARLEKEIGGEYALLAQWLGEIRACQSQANASQADRAQLYDSIIRSDVLRSLRNGERKQARQIFEALLREGAVT